MSLSKQGVAAAGERRRETGVVDDRAVEVLQCGIGVLAGEGAVAETGFRWIERRRQFERRAEVTIGGAEVARLQPLPPGLVALDGRRGSQTFRRRRKDEVRILLGDDSRRSGDLRRAG